MGSLGLPSPIRARPRRYSLAPSLLTKRSSPSRLPLSVPAPARKAPSSPTTLPPPPSLHSSVPRPALRPDCLLPIAWTCLPSAKSVSTASRPLPLETSTRATPHPTRPPSNSAPPLAWAFRGAHARASDGGARRADVEERPLRDRSPFCGGGAEPSRPDCRRKWSGAAAEVGWAAAGSLR